MSVETELYLVDELEIEHHVLPALRDFLDRGDAAAARKLIQTTESSQQFQLFLKEDRAQAEYLCQGSHDISEGWLPQEVLDDTGTGEPIRDIETIRKHATERILSRFLVLFSSAHGLDRPLGGITLNRGALGNYIRARSKWIDDMLSLSNEFLGDAPDLRPSIGGSAKLLTRNQANMLLNALQSTPPPTDLSLSIEYQNLKQVLEIAVSEPRYRVLVWTV